MIKATLEVATFRRGPNGSSEEQTTQVPATLFGKIAETFEKYVEPGHLVQLIGRLDGFERKSSNGATWLTTNFVVEQLILLPNVKRANFDTRKPEEVLL